LKGRPDGATSRDAGKDAFLSSHLLGRCHGITATNGHDFIIKLFFPDLGDEFWNKIGRPRPMPKELSPVP
jgi:hypothetical protein